MAILNNSNAISSGGYDINNSLRFRSSASAYLNRTPASAGNRKTWTWSGWVKRGNIDAEQFLFGRSTVNLDTGYTNIQFNGSQLEFSNWSGGINVRTTQLFRDPSSWYHIIVALDTTQATASNRVKFYVNGSQVTAFSTANYPTLNQDLVINDNAQHLIGARTGTALYFDGYLSEVNFIDGQALTPSSFGETDAATGSWVAKKYTGTYGTNGFYLKFSDIATTSGSNAGLGKDFSGNANYWTTNNISVTSGTTYDAMIDSPTLTSETVANYAVLNPLDTGANTTISDGNLKYVTSSNAAVGTCRGTFGVTSGKWYFEVTAGSTANANTVGIANANMNVTTGLGDNANGWGYSNDGYVYNNGSFTATGATWGSGDIAGIAFDADSGKLWFAKNNTWVLSGNPSAGTSPTFTGLTGNTFFPAVSDYGGGSTSNLVANFGQRPFAYTPPTGFVRLNTFNLPDSTIKKGNTVMDATIYTGTGASLSVTNTSAFKPDFVWVKGRSGATDHALYDSVRGTTIDLVSNSTAAETTQAQGLTAFGTGGFTVGTLAKMNTSAATYVGWQWQAGQGSTSSNTSGTITSTVSVNATAGFSVVTYTGTGAVGTVGHGLGVAPKMIIAKSRSTTNAWGVYTVSTGNTGFLLLNSTAAFATDVNAWNNTSPTSSVFSLGNGGFNAGTMVAYCWAEIAGYSKFGSYTGNGSADGPFIATNFAPKFVMIKASSGATGNWFIYDSVRNTYNITENFLLPNSADAEAINADYKIDILSNGFKLRTTGSQINGNTFTYIYACFAEVPTKFSNAR